MPVGGRDRHANRPLDIEITPARAAAIVGVMSQALLVKAEAPVGA
jgi:hypothetical protein